jgi:NADPH:quinone reductase-like Zn-dependent oxidoreductase
MTPLEPSSRTMAALRAHQRGGSEQLHYEQAPRPEPQPGEALIAVHAAGITFSELDWDETWLDADGTDRTPVVPSHEVSGVVASLGDATRSLAIGDEVYGLIGFNHDGAAAEYVSLPADDLALRPLSVTHIEAASLPLAALTAWQALVDHANVQPDEHVLVRGGAGGVGVFAVQLAAHLGAHVTATASARDVDFVTSLGAERVIDYTDESKLHLARKTDVLIDAVGGPFPASLYPVLRAGGRLVTLSAPPSPAEAARHEVQAVFFIVSPSRGQLGHLAGLVDQGDLKPIVAQTFPLADGQQAYQNGPNYHHPGKTVLVVR